MSKYEDIINLPHHVSKVRKQMSLENRSAQFAPFAALTGYDESIKESSRITERKKELSENEKDVINNKLCLIYQKIKEKPLISVEYFTPDKNKEGGKYNIITGNVRVLDVINDKIIFVDKTNINISDIINIDEIIQ